MKKTNSSRLLRLVFAAAIARPSWGLLSMLERYAKATVRMGDLWRSSKRGLAVASAGIASVLPGMAQGTADPGFNPNADNSIGTVAVQPDGKLVIGGSFQTVAGVARSRLARLNADGTLDPAFNPSANDSVFGATVQADGKILIAGWFTTVNGIPRSNIARLEADGTLDAGFNPAANNLVLNSAVQSDGKIVIVGGFHLLGTAFHDRIARLNADGTPDAGFNPDANAFVNCAAIQPDGKILVGGLFSAINGIARNRIARLNADGTVDLGFDPNPGPDIAPSEEIRSITVQADGKIVIGGSFTAVGGTARNSIARIDADGTVDASFNPGASGFVNGMVLQADGKIIIAGMFTSVGGVPRNYIARLLATGALDVAFNPNANSNVEGLAIGADGRVVIVGPFTSVDATPRNSIARLLNDPATQTLTNTSANRVQWLRGGSAPETLQVTFENSADGATWTNLGAGTRIAAGWELAGLTLRGAGTIRARARTTSAYLNGSSGLVESMQTYLINPNSRPIAHVLPISQVVKLGAPFSLDAGFSDMDGDRLTYQWLKGTTVLKQGQVTSLVGGATVTPPPLELVSGGNFDLGVHQIELQVSDGFNPTVSAVASVTVAAATSPTLVVPRNQIVDATAPTGATVNYPRATFSNATGTVTITYSKASGSVFPLGTTTVTVTAVDGAGNRATGTFKVTVEGAMNQVEDLIRYLSGLNINVLTKLGLVARLASADLALALRAPQIASSTLLGFINEVQKLRGTALTTAQADRMISDGTRIRCVIGIP